MSYVTLAAFKEAITIADPVDDTDLQRALDAATEWITYYTGRTFAATDAVASAKYFLPTETDRLTVPDLSTVTELAIDTLGDESFSEILAAADYDLFPLNLVPGQGGYTEIRLKPTAPTFFVLGYQARVTALWGYGSIPAGVEQACILLANRYFHRLSVPFATLEAAQTGELATLIDRDWDIMNLLSPFVSTEGAGAGRSNAWVLV